MKDKKNVFRRVGPVKLVSVVMMITSLVFLTSINFFIYPSQKQTSQVSADRDGSKNNIPPSGPTEEKSSSAGVSILEEFLHDPHPVISFGIVDQLHLHGVADAGKILVYHGELLSPPPEV